MKFEKYNIKDINKAFRRSSNMKLLDDFKESGLKCAKVTEWTCKKSGYCATSIQQTIKRYKEEYKNILCISRNGSVFLINEAVDK